MPEQASSPTLASLEATGRPITSNDIQQKPYSLNVGGVLGGVDVSPPMRLSGIAMRAAGLGSLNIIQKYELEAQDHFFTCYGKHNTNNGHCEVKHKRQASVSCFIQVLCL